MSAGINIQINQWSFVKLKGLQASAYKYLKHNEKDDRSKFFLVVSDDIMRGDSQKSQFGMIEYNVRKSFLMGG